MMVGSCFSQGSFTGSAEPARAALSTGVTFRGTSGRSQGFCDNVDGGVQIAVDDEPARLAGVDTIMQVLILVDPPASATSLARREPTVDDNQVNAMPRGFVLKLSSDLAKVAITD